MEMSVLRFFFSYFVYFGPVSALFEKLVVLVVVVGCH